MTTTKPVPVPDDLSRPFWDGCARGELFLQECTACGTLGRLPRVACPRCSTSPLRWRRSSGRGEVHSFTVVRRPPSPAFAADVPYVLALVELDEGVRMMTNLLGVPVEEARIGLPVEVAFEIRAGISLPMFRRRPT